MTSLEDRARQLGVSVGGAQPTGIPDDALEAARAITTEIGRRVNLPSTTGHTGVLLAGIDRDRVGDLAQVSIALSLTDIATSLRILAGREGD